MDAMIFVTVLAIVSVTLITVQPEDDTGPSASGILDDMEKVKLGSDLISDNSGNISMGIWDIYAASESSGDSSFISCYICDVITDELGGRYGFRMEISYGYHHTVIGSPDSGKHGNPVSECTRSMDVLGNTDVLVKLTVFE